MQCRVPWGGYVYMNIVVGMIHGGLALKYIGGNILAWCTVSERWSKVEACDL